MKISKYILVVSIVLSSQIFAQSEDEACYSCMLQDGKIAAATSEEVQEVEEVEEMQINRDKVLEAILVREGTRHLDIYVERAFKYLEDLLPEEVEGMDIIDAKIQASLSDQVDENARIVFKTQKKSTKKTQVQDIKIINKALTNMLDLILSM